MFYSYDHRAIMFTIVVNGIGDYDIVILPKGQKINRTLFTECVVGPFAK
jgi:hypothetical protein